MIGLLLILQKNEAGGERIKVLLKKKEDVAERVKRGC